MCIRDSANIELMEREGIVDHAREMADYFAEALASLRDLPGVAETRAVGLVGCVQCLLDPTRADGHAEDKAFTLKIDERCFELGLIVRPLGDLCVISPPLIITRDQIDEMVAILARAIREIGAAHGLSAKEPAAV